MIAVLASGQRLERDLHAKLDLPTRGASRGLRALRRHAVDPTDPATLAKRLAKLRVCNRGIGIGAIQTIDQIVSGHSQFGLKSFEDYKRFGDVGLCVQENRTSQIGELQRIHAWRIGPQHGETRLIELFLPGGIGDCRIA